MTPLERGMAEAALDDADAREGIRAVFEGRRREYSLEYQGGDATDPRWFLLSVSALAGGQTGAILARSDITERREADEELRRAKQAAEAADHAKSAFLASMSHELRTPLNAIIGFSQLLEEQKGGPLNERQRKYVRNILVSGRQLLELIDNVLDLTRVEAARMSLQLSLADVGTILNDMQSLVRHLAEKKQLGMTIEIDETVPPITADQPKVKQVLFSLLSNAIKFTPDGGQVRVTARRAPSGTAEEWIEIAVADTGIGIPLDQQEDVFEVFARGDTSPGRAVQEGGGLGLALARRLVELHGGRIGLDSEVGKGTTVSFQLPVAARPRDPPPIPTRADSGGERLPSGPLVLVVEDDPQASELLSHYLTESGHAVARAYSGEQAIQLAQQLRPAAITLDTLLPDRDGLEVLALLKSLPATRDIPVVVVSVTDQSEAGLRLGALAWFVKPVSRADLLDVLEGALRPLRAPSGVPQEGRHG